MACARWLWFPLGCRIRPGAAGESYLPFPAFMLLYVMYLSHPHVNQELPLLEIPCLAS